MTALVIWASLERQKDILNELKVVPCLQCIQSLNKNKKTENYKTFEYSSIITHKIFTLKKH